jgi:hypothetical protein
LRLPTLRSPTGDAERTPVYTNRLQCVECNRVSREGERGWAARLTVDDEVVVYCPECDRRELA